MYCCVEHQREDWARHKVECGFLAGLGFHALLYKPSEALPRGEF